MDALQQNLSSISKNTPVIIKKKLAENYIYETYK